MAGCVSSGIQRFADDTIGVQGPSPKTKPAGLDVTQPLQQGLHLDAGTNALWVVPRLARDVAPVAPVPTSHTITPTGTGSVALGVNKWHYVAPTAYATAYHILVVGGHAGFNAGNGNLWVVHRVAALSVNGTPVGFEDVLCNAINNNTGGVSGVAGPPEGVSLFSRLEPGDTLDYTLTWSLDIDTWTTNAANLFTWRPPMANLIVTPVEPT